jgi:triacylglycerol lipase
VLARLLRLIIFGALTAMSAWFVLFWRTGQRDWAIGGVVVVILTYAGIMALEFAINARVNRGDLAPSATFAQRAEAWWGEVRSGIVVFCWRQPFRSRRWDDFVSESNIQGQRGIVLVHGFVCNRGLWNPWLPRLRERGIAHIAVNLEPVFGSIDDYASVIEGAVQRIECATGLPPVIIAHSMGGLAVRRWWGEVDVQRVHRVVTIGTPHRGTWLARFALSPNGRQMRLGHEWSGALAQRQTPGIVQRLICFYGHCDNVVFPASNATVPGADNRHLEAVAHLRMADRPEPLAEVLRLCQPAVNSRSLGSTEPAAISGKDRTAS